MLVGTSSTPPSAARLLAAATLLLAGCGGGTGLTTPPPPPPASFTITAVPDSEDLATAQALGWGAGLPSAEVSLAAVDSSRPAVSLRTDAQGSVALTAPAAGDYQVTVTRWLTATERGTLPAGDDAVGFVIRAPLRVSPGTTARIAVPASRRRALVISEHGFNYLHDPLVYYYPYGGYLELFNNSDTTIYLDGMRVGMAYSVDADYAVEPCAGQMPLKNDPDFLWSLKWDRFPGSGRDYPMVAGRTVTIATDAIDHRALVAEGLDLRNADFEFTGPADVDNPAVPNMIPDGLRQDAFDHGFTGDLLGAVLFVAAPVELPSLPSRFSPTGYRYLGFPRAKILESVALRSRYIKPQPECLPFAHPNFDRAPERLISDKSGFAETIQRRFATVPGVARPILQHTRSARSDFWSAPHTPGGLPPQP